MDFRELDSRVHPIHGLQEERILPRLTPKEKVPSERKRLPAGAIKSVTARGVRSRIVTSLWILVSSPPSAERATQIQKKKFLRKEKGLRLSKNGDPYCHYYSVIHLAFVSIVGVVEALVEEFVELVATLEGGNGLGDEILVEYVAESEGFIYFVSFQTVVLAVGIVLTEAFGHAL